MRYFLLHSHIFSLELWISELQVSKKEEDRMIPNEAQKTKNPFVI